jgi:exodeoxyribonuclease X
MRWVVLDTETSGLTTEDGPCEIAWQELDDNLVTIDAQYSLIDPQRPISPSASGIHQITDAMVADAPTLEEFLFQVLDDPFGGPEPVVIIAHNAQFDYRFVKPYITTPGGKLCTLKMARLTYPDADNHKLQTLRFYLDLAVSRDAHSAAGDVEVTANLLRHMCEITNQDIYTLFDVASKPTLVEKMTFGKHKGVKVADLPDGYVDWLLKLDNLDDNLRFTLEGRG